MTAHKSVLHYSNALYLFYNIFEKLIYFSNLWDYFYPYLNNIIFGEGSLQSKNKEILGTLFNASSFITYFFHFFILVAWDQHELPARAGLKKNPRHLSLRGSYWGLAPSGKAQETYKGVKKKYFLLSGYHHPPVGLR